MCVCMCMCMYVILLVCMCVFDIYLGISMPLAGALASVLLMNAPPFIYYRYQLVYQILYWVCRYQLVVFYYVFLFFSSSKRLSCTGLVFT